MIERSESVTTRINHIIRDRVLNGIYFPGSRLPSEQELASEFGVSRSTLRIAVNSLVTEGVIIRKHGNGSYVNQHAVQFNAQLQNLWSFPQLIRESGKTPRVTYLKGETRKPTDSEQAMLELDSTQTVFVLQRIFMADDLPAIYSTNIIPTSIICFNPTEIDVQQSIYDILLKYCDQELVYSVSELHADIASDEVQKYLQLQDKKPVIRFNDVFFTKYSQPVVVGYNYYNDQLLLLRLVRSKA